MKWKLEAIIAFVEARLSVKRFTHVKGVVETARTLAKRHGVLVADAELAAWLHDVAKEQNSEQAKRMLKLSEEHAYLAHSDKIWHAPLGAVMAKETFGIEQVDILNAIKFHTTGRVGMSDLEKVIFVADYTEPHRTFAGCEAVRALWGDLDAAVCEILQQKLAKVKAKDVECVSHPDTVLAYAYYSKKVGS